jgi:hypothetical protein
MNAYRRKILGVLALANPHHAEPPPAGLDDADWFAYPTLVKTVPNAWARDVVAGSPALAQAYADTARELEKAGACAITADCGYTIAYQEAVRNAVSIPVACSSLLQLPLLRNMLPRNGRIGLLCFDQTTLSPDHLHRAGLEDHRVLAIEGIAGTRSWQNWVAPDTITEWDVLENDVMAAARKLWKENPDITHFLLECAGFPRFRPLLKAMTGKPVFDWVTLCNQLMDGAAARDVYT